jgi:hypothetical protein
MGAFAGAHKGRHSRSSFARARIMTTPNDGFRMTDASLATQDTVSETHLDP